MPPRYRDAFMQGVILTQGSPDRCLRAYPTNGFEEQAALYTERTRDHAQRPRPPPRLLQQRLPGRAGPAGPGADPADPARLGRPDQPHRRRRRTANGLKSGTRPDFDAAVEQEEAEFRQTWGRTIDYGSTGTPRAGDAARGPRGPRRPPGWSLRRLHAGRRRSRGSNHGRRLAGRRSPWHRRRRRGHGAGPASAWRASATPLRYVHGNFRDIDRICRERGFAPVNGILFDLGFRPTSWPARRAASASA